MSAKLLDEKIRDQLNAIPSLNEYFNRLPCNTKDWIIEAVKQAFKEWLEQNRKEEYITKVPAILGEVLPSNAYRIRNEVVDRLIQIIVKESESKQ